MPGIVALFLFVVALQTALIKLHHFTPFEREVNARAVAWGARPAPRYWAVLALDACTGVLLALLALSLWPRFSGTPAMYGVREASQVPLARFVRMLPAWLAGVLLAGAAHHYVNEATICFPNLKLMARRLAMALAWGALAVGAVLLAIALASVPDLSRVLVTWARIVAALAVPAGLLALLVFMVQALAFLLRVLPVLGTGAHAAASTFLLAWLMGRYGVMVGSGDMTLVFWPGLKGLEGVAIGLGALALAALILAWRLPGPSRRPDAVDPPPIVVGQPAGVTPLVSITPSGASLASPRLRVEVTRAPFGLVVQDTQGETLWQLAPKGLTRDTLLYSIVSIPALYTGNTLKFKRRAWGKALEQVLALEADGDALRITLDGGVLRLSFHAGDVLRCEFQPAPSRAGWAFNALSLAWLAPDDAHYLGFGQRFGRVDQRGSEVPSIVEEGGVGYAGLAPILKPIVGERGSLPNGEQCTSFPVPFFLSSRERGATTGVFWNTYLPSWVKLPPHAAAGRPAGQPGAGLLRLTVLGDRLDVYLCAGPTAMDAIEQYTALTGRPTLPPAWALLPWKTRTGAVTESDVLEDVRKFRELDIPLAQVGVEHWQEVRGSYEFSPRWYLHIDDMIAQARQNGYRVTIWHFPYMNAGSAAHREGVRRGYFLLNRLGLPYQQRIFHGVATVIDYSNPQAAAWHEALVKERLYQRGFHSAMTDYGESIPPGCVCYNGQSGLEMRNAYPLLYVQSMQRAAREAWGDDYLIYPRAGYAGSQRFINAQWPGDQDTDWDEGDGLPAAVRAMLNVSMCGFPVHGSDIGGWYDWFAPITTKELFVRWAEVGAYSPLMRAHGGPIGRNREPWKFDQETVDIYRALSQEHVKLFPYLYSLAQQASQTGAPIIRHPALIWPGQPELYQVEDAWLIGEALYVAPVVKPGLTRREVILPPGEWWSLNDGQPLRGPARIVVDAPLGQTPRFLRRGFILPRFARAFDAFEETLQAQARAKAGSLDDELEVWLYPAEGEASFVLFDGSALRAQTRQGQTSCSSGARRATWRLWGS